MARNRRENTYIVTKQEESKRPTINSASRIASVEREYLSGIESPAEIARRLELNPYTVTNDIKWLKEYWSHKYDTETLRKALSLETENILNIAKERFINENSAKDGRLALEAIGRIAKMNSIDETVAQQQIGEALSALVMDFRMRRGGNTEIEYGENSDTFLLEANN